MLLVSRFSVFQSLFQVIDFQAHFPNNSDQHASLLNLYLTSSPNSCCAMQLSPLGNSSHVIVSTDISFDLSIRHESPIHKNSFWYQHTNWNSFFNFLCDDPWSEIISFPIENYASGVSSCMKWH